MATSVGVGKALQRTLTSTFSDWSKVGARDHAVQFYAHDKILIDLVGRYVGRALISGDAALLVTTPTHRAAVDRQLKTRGLDVAVARREGRYLFVDAADILAEVSLGGWPNRERFLHAVGTSLSLVSAALSGNRRRVSVFAEMMALLWTAGQTDAAIRLEEFWNDLVQQQAFSLCCAYPISGLSNERHTAPFLKICAHHTHVFPAERRDRLTSRFA